MLIAHATASPRDRARRSWSRPAAPAAAAPRRWSSRPPADRHRPRATSAATCNARAAAAAGSRGSRRKAANAASAASPPSAGGGRKAARSRPAAMSSAPATLGSARRKSLASSGPPASREAADQPGRELALIEIAHPGHPQLREGRPEIGLHQLLPLGERRAVRAEDRARVRIGEQRAADQRQILREGAADRDAEARHLLGRDHQLAERSAAVAGVERIEPARQHRQRGRPVAAGRLRGQRGEQDRLRPAAPRSARAAGRRRGRRRRRRARLARAA